MIEEDLINKREDGKYELTKKGEDIVSKTDWTFKTFSGKGTWNGLH
jgi:hypothetical protein